MVYNTGNEGRSQSSFLRPFVRSDIGLDEVYIIWMSCFWTQSKIVSTHHYTEISVNAGNSDLSWSHLVSQLYVWWINSEQRLECSNQQKEWLQNFGALGVTLIFFFSLKDPSRWQDWNHTAMTALKVVLNTVAHKGLKERSWPMESLTITTALMWSRESVVQLKVTSVSQLCDCLKQSIIVLITIWKRNASLCFTMLSMFIQR